MKDTSDVLTVFFDSGLNDESALCVSRKHKGKTIMLKMELGEQADILYHLLTEQMTKAEIKADNDLDMKLKLMEANVNGYTQGLKDASNTEQEPAYCDRNICMANEYNGIGCDECEVTKSQEPNTVIATGDGAYYRIKELIGDAVSRQAVLNNLCNSCTNIGCEFQSGIVRTECAFYMPPNIESDNCGNYVVIPSVKPQEPKTGHWIMPVQDDGMSDPIYYQVRCSKCGFDLDPQTWHMELHQYGADKYCPHCGARMVEPQERSDKE